MSTKPPTLPLDILNENVLDVGLNQITQDQKRRTRAHNVFNTQVREGESADIAMECAFQKASTGLKNEQTKLAKALEAVRIYPSQPTTVYANEVQTTDKDGFAWATYAPPRSVSRGTIGWIMGAIIAGFLAVLFTPWIYMQYSIAWIEPFATFVTFVFVSTLIIGAALSGRLIAMLIMNGTTVPNEVYYPSKTTT